jgi:phosphoglycerate dehydrogenase-like enzyme
MPSKPRALVLLRPSLYRVLFTDQVDTDLQSLVEATFNVIDEDWSSEELAERIGGYQIAVTGWGSPKFSEGVVDAADRLELVAHSAGSIKHMLPPHVFDRGIRVTHAASAIAPAVAEMSLLLLLLLLRRPHRMDSDLRRGRGWAEAREIAMGQELSGLRVGVLGAGYTGRCFIEMLRPLGAEVWVYDPYFTEADALGMGVTKAGLDEMLSECKAISLQAPVTSETYHMIGARELGLLQDGAVLVNTARSAVIDEAALVAALESGRIRAALDVFDEEPLPADHPLLKLNNAFLTPHVAGATSQARERQGQTVVDEIRRYVETRTLRYEVTRDMLRIMA